MIKEGDYVIIINGCPTNEMTFDQVMDMLDAPSLDLTLDLLRVKPIDEVETLKPSNLPSSHKVNLPSTSKMETRSADEEKQRLAQPKPMERPYTKICAEVDDEVDTHNDKLPEKYVSASSEEEEEEEMSEGEDEDEEEEEETTADEEDEEEEKARERKVINDKVEGNAASDDREEYEETEEEEDEEEEEEDEDEVKEENKVVSPRETVIKPLEVPLVVNKAAETPTKTTFQPPKAPEVPKPIFKVTNIAQKLLESSKTTNNERETLEINGFLNKMSEDDNRRIKEEVKQPVEEAFPFYSSPTPRHLPTSAAAAATRGATTNGTASADGSANSFALPKSFVGTSPKSLGNVVGGEKQHVENTTTMLLKKNKFQCQTSKERDTRGEEVNSWNCGGLQDGHDSTFCNGLSSAENEDKRLISSPATDKMKTSEVPMFKVSKVVGRSETWTPSTGYTRPSNIISSYQSDVWKRLKKPNASGPRPKSMPMDLENRQMDETTHFDELRNGRAKSEEKDSTTVSNGHPIPIDSNRLMKIFQPAESMENLDILLSRKKMFSSSSFYEEPRHIYPTVEEQVELCKKISDSLSSDSNQLSKGASMYNRRKKRAHNWVFEGPDPAESDTGIGYSSSPDIGNYNHNSYNNTFESHTHSKLKLVLDPRTLQDANRLKHLGVYNEHNLISPDICFNLVKDLNSPTGKGAALFAKRKKKSEKWVVDENTVKQHEIKQQNVVEENAKNSSYVQTQPPLSHLEAYEKMMQTRRLKLVKSPWEAALESPIGSCDAAFQELRYEERITPKYNGQVHHIKRTEEVRTYSPCPSTITPTPTPSVPTASSPFATLEPPQVSHSASPISLDTSNVGSRTFSPNLNRYSGSFSDIYKPRAPRGWGGQATDHSSINLAHEAPSYLDVSSSTLDGTPFSPNINFDINQCKNFNNTARLFCSNGLNRSQSFKSVRPPSLVF